MTEEEIFEKLRPILVDQLKVEEEKVTLEATFIDDLNADSLEMVDLIIVIEEEFRISVSDEDAEKIKTVGDAVKMLYDKISQKGE